MISDGEKQLTRFPGNADFLGVGGAVLNPWNLSTAGVFFPLEDRGGGPSRAIPESESPLESHFFRRRFPGERALLAGAWGDLDGNPETPRPVRFPGVDDERGLRG